ncbi:MAG: SIS domain-containing protein [Phycisphaerae bacterium]|nr:SIS domain-containing protein [Phycisphaerae bacterium]
MPLSNRADRDAVRDAGNELIRHVQKVMQNVNWLDLLELTDMLPEASRIFVTGAGRSGLVGRMFGMRLMHAGLTAFVTGETITPAATGGDLLVAISCTGTTGYTAYLVERAKQLGAKVVAITAEADSPLATTADKTVIIPMDIDDIVLKAAVFEHATGLCLDAVFNVISERLKVDAAAFQSRHANLE